MVADDVACRNRRCVDDQGLHLSRPVPSNAGIANLSTVPSRIAPHAFPSSKRAWK